MQVPESWRSPVRGSHEALHQTYNLM